MKYLFIIFLLLFSSVSWSEDINLDDLIKRDGLYYEKFTDVPFTGEVTGKEQGKISKGKREGEWLWYFENGQLRRESYYKEGKKDGKWTAWYENGQLWYERYFNNDKRVYNWLMWHNNGKKWSDVYWLNDEYVVRKSWDKNGKLWLHIDVEKGIRFNLGISRMKS